MEKVSRSMLYKEKDSIRFFLGEGNTLECDFNKKLWERPFWRGLKDKATNTLRLFNNACYICTRAFYDDYPPNDLDEYIEIAIDDHDDFVWKTHIVPVTMALVVNWFNSEECQNITIVRGRREEIKELCRRIRVSIEDRGDLTLEGKEDFQALIIQDHQLPSGFINDGCFLPRLFSEAMSDPSLNHEDILGNLEYIADNIANNPNEWVAVFEDPNFIKEVSKVSIKTEEKQRMIWEFLNKQFKDDNEQPQVREKSFNGKPLMRTYHLVPKMNGHVAKLIAAMYDCGMFLKEDDTPTSNVEDVAHYLGAALGVDFSNWRQTLHEAIMQQNCLDIFDDLKQKIKERKQKKQ